MVFGPGKILGRTTNDVMCLFTNWGKEMCVDPGFNFFEVTKTESIAMLPQYSGILGVAPDHQSNGPSFVDKLHEAGIIGRKMMSLLIQKNPLSSYVTFGGKTDSMMMTVNKTQPIIWYNSTSELNWKLKVTNTHVRDSSNKWKFYSVYEDDSNFAFATVDSFFRAVLIPQGVFPDFVKIINSRFNETEGPAKGRVWCEDTKEKGICWVNKMQCSEAMPHFSDIVLEMDDRRGLII